MATSEQANELRRDEIDKLAKFLNNTDAASPVELAEELYDRLEISYADEIGRYVSVGTGESGDAEDGGTGDSSASG